MVDEGKPMDGAELDISKLANDWIDWALWQHEHSLPNNPFIVGYAELSWLVEDAPEQAWQVVLEVVANPRAAPILGILAAGPVEDLLSFHGSIFIDRIEARAADDPIFAAMLDGVSQFTMSDDVWSRVEAAARQQAS